MSSSIWQETRIVQKWDSQSEDEKLYMSGLKAWIVWLKIKTVVVQAFVSFSFVPLSISQFCATVESWHKLLHVLFSKVIACAVPKHTIDIIYCGLNVSIYA